MDFATAKIIPLRINFAVALDAWIDIGFPFRVHNRVKSGSCLVEHNAAVHKGAKYAPLVLLPWTLLCKPALLLPVLFICRTASHP